MDMKSLQRLLADHGWYAGAIDGIYGPQTRAALLRAFKAKTRAPATNAEIADAAAAIMVTPAHLLAVREVEAGGQPFGTDGLPTILFEPHVFSRETQRRFDRSHPDLSYRVWGARPYPKGQRAQWDRLLDAIGLDPAAACAATSWGGFQIMGFNAAACGYGGPVALALGMADSEAEQLRAVVRYIDARNLDDALRRGDWAAFAAGYNGPGYRANRYDERLAAAYVKHHVGV